MGSRAFGPAKQSGSRLISTVPSGINLSMILLGNLSGLDSPWLHNRPNPLTVSTSHRHHVYPSNQLYWFWYYNYLKALTENDNEEESTKYAQVRVSNL